jgi:alpha-tubulin suppressor-like RCC1 family protein
MTHSSLDGVTRRLLLAVTSLFGLASITATGCSAGEEDKTLPVSGNVTVSDESVTVPQGGVATLRVDVEGLPEGQGVLGYSIDLSEEASHIDIASSACPSGVGTLSCRDFRISPALSSAPGVYLMRIVTVGSLARLTGAAVRIIVVNAQPPVEPAALVTSRHVITSDGRLWSTGSNSRGQAGVGFWNACTDPIDERCLQPTAMRGYARVGVASDWTDVASSKSNSLGIRADDTVWIWGDNARNYFGFASTGGAELGPRQVVGLTGARRVSVGWITQPSGRFEPPDQVAFMVLTAAGNVYAFGGYRQEGPVDGAERTIDGPRLVPQAVSGDCVESPLSDVVDIAGATGNTGIGMALALKRDGSVWYWGRQVFYSYEDIEHNSCRAPSQGMPVRVPGLPAAVTSIAVGVRQFAGSSEPTLYDAYALVATIDGEVLTWQSPHESIRDTTPTPERVSGLSDIRAVSADDDGNAVALGQDGTVWRWRPGESAPQPVMGLPAIAALGRGTAEFAIAADCGGSIGSLWSLVDASRIPMFGTTCGTQLSYRLAITQTGQGSVLTDPLVLNCSASCSAQVPVGSWVWLYSQPALGWHAPRGFSCSGSHLLSDGVRIDRDTQCDIAFEPTPLPRTLAVDINGGGRVVSAPPGIDCPDDCTETYAAGPDAGTVTLTLTTIASPGWRFDSFSGDPECGRASFEMSGSHQCEARFVALPAPAMPAGFTATADTQAVRLAWSAVTDYSVLSYRLERAEGTNASRTIADGLAGRSSQYVDASVLTGRQYTYRLFAANLSGESAPALATVTVGVPATVTLTVTVSGSGSVTSVPGGISCGTDCTEDFAPGASVTLTALVTSSSHFDGWSGDCAGTAPNVIVVMDANRNCTARFSAVSAGGWQTLASELATSLETDVRSAVVLDPQGEAFIAELLRVPTQDRLIVSREGAGMFVALGGALNANLTWSATSADLLLDPVGVPILAYNADNADSYVARWDGSQWRIVSPQPFRLGANDTRRPRIVRSGNTLIAAWIEGARIAVRRYDLATQQWDAGSFTPDPDGSSAIAGPRDLDLAVDSGGLAVVAYSVGATAGVLRVARETSPGVWTALGGDVGIRPGTAPTVQEFGLHVDSSDVVRIAWVEGTVNYFVQLAQFDGVNWGPLPGRIETRFFQSSPPVRSLSVNRNRALFAFAYAVDRDPDPTQSDVVVQQWVGNALVSVGTAFATQHPRVGSLSLAMNEANKATLLQSQYTTTGGVDRYTLLVRRHQP